MKKISLLLLIALLAFACKKEKVDHWQEAQDAEAALTEIEKQKASAKEGGVLTPEIATELDEAWGKQFEATKAAYAAYYAESINTPDGQEVFATSRWTRRLNADQLEKVLNAVTDESFKAGELYEKQAMRLRNMKDSTPGNIYKDIESTDQEGNQICLSHFVGHGKYVLLDFWASWCPPCRADMPALVELYETYKDRNFEIVGYSLDQNKEAWLNGIEGMNMSWPQMSDLAYWDSPAVALYAVQSIPCTFLIDPDGKIIERGRSIEELKQIIALIIK